MDGGGLFGVYFSCYYSFISYEKINNDTLPIYPALTMGAPVECRGGAERDSNGNDGKQSNKSEEKNKKED
ncbi:MAG TPA: hypothetical protein VNM45_18260 [Bacillus sp. (in: firmicutes)]|nr:hypothetical protein [Bacillus sp. (in: firmicutes)]